MYKWITAVGLRSDIIFDKLIIECQLFNDFNQSNLFPMSTEMSSMIAISLYDQQWIPNISDQNNFETHINIDQSDQSDESPIINNQWTSNIDKDDNEMHTYNPHDEFDQSQTNLHQPIDLYFSLIDSVEDFDNERYMSLMSEINLETEHDKDLRDRIIKQKKTSNFGFTSLQRRIERVKHDLFNLTNKLNMNCSEDLVNEAHCYYNLGIGNIVEDKEENSINDVINNEEKQESDKLWKCTNQLNSKNPFSELSESTQKILGRLNLKEEEEENSKQLMELDDEEIEMEEDELEFTFSNRQNNFLNSFITKGGTLPIIEEQDEDDLSSDDESESAKSTVIERCIVTAENGSSTSKSVSLHSFDVTDSGEYITPLSSFRICEHKLESSDDTEEYFSDFAKCSVSSYSSRESLKSQDVEKVDVSCTETTLRAEQDYLEQVSENCLSVRDKSSSSLKGEDDFASEAEYDNSGWSTEDVPQSAEQSDSLYDKPYRPMIKSSLPDLLESSDNHDMDNLGGSLITRHYNKSTDLDEILDQVTYNPPSPGRLSQSLCNLFTTKSNKVIMPDDFFEERTSFNNLLETDLDSGYVSIYKPVKETEILSKVDFSCSMGNINSIDGNCNHYESPLIDRLRKKAGSVTELRIADSLTKLNIPRWLNLRDDDECERLYDIDSNIISLPIQRSPSSLCRTLESSHRKVRSLSREVSDNCYFPIIKPKSTRSVVLPSQLLRQSCQRKLIPIKFCQARKLILPNKMSLNDIN